MRRLRLEELQPGDMFREWSDRLNAYDDIELCICVTQDETGRYAVGSLTSEGRLRTSLHAPGSTLLGLVHR